MTELRTIGILGGMGPQATILLQERLLQSVIATDDVDHIPLIVDMNTQVPSRIKWLIEGTGVDPAPTLASMAKRLIDAGAEALGMPCNTAHAFAEDIENASSVPFFNMPNLAAKDIAEAVPSGSKIGILASPATKKTNLFVDALAPHGLTTVYPEDDATMLETIKTIKSNGPSDATLAALNSAARALEDKGAAALIVGCSEFSLLSRDIAAGIPIIDTLDGLTRHLHVFSHTKPKAASPP